MRNLSLRYKLFLVLSATVIFYAIFSVLFVNLYLKSVWKKHLVDMGKTLAATMSANITDDILLRNLIKLDAFFEDTMRNNHDVSYVFVEKNGHVLLHTFRNGFPKDLLNSGHKKNTVDFVLFVKDRETYYDFSSPILGGEEGVLRLGISGKMIEEPMNKTINSLLYIALATVIAALLFSIIISRKLIKPLSLLTDSAIKIADGDYSKNAHEFGNDEVGKLSHAFNKMSDAVKLREKELREINEELEAVNIKLHEYIEELNKTKDELVKSKQDKAVLETSRAMIHHMRQPLTYLTMSIELFTDEIKDGTFDMDAIQKKLYAIEEASRKVSKLLEKFEKLNEYRTIEFSDKTKIIDIGE